MRLFFLLFLLSPALADFSIDFSQWLASYYGSDIRDVLERRDLGPTGSFGGKARRDEALDQQPVVFVHGVSDTAGEKMRQAANHFRSRGYKNAELYSTTYSNGAQNNPLQWAQYSMRCEFVKQVRALIVALRLYTGRAVDVVGFSMGVVVARKAVLGGRCVDTGEDLGAPLTHVVDTFVGVAGPNHGINLQVGGVSIPGCVFSVLPVCNPVTGLYSGVCPSESSYLQDINSLQRYEAQHIFTVASKKDQLVGYQVCNFITSEIPGQEGGKVYEEKNHDQTFDDSFEVIRRMVLDHVII